MSEAEHEEHRVEYIKVWGVLLVLLVVSVLGPMAEIQVLTLITAFGIAIVKAYLVARNFMHINVERQYIVYMMVTCLVFMLLLFAGTAPDVMESDGRNWEKHDQVWQFESHRAAAAGGEHGAAAHH